MRESSYSVLNRTSTPFTRVQKFVTRLTVLPSEESSSESTDDEPVISPLAQLPAYLAIEFLADSSHQESKLAEGDAVKASQAAVVRFQRLLSRGLG